MVKLNLYTIKGTKKSDVSLPKHFQEEVNLPLLAQSIRVYEDRRHFGLSKTKTRGEVSISTRKIWRQKGTGRARHGARSAPIFVGGGIAHGPRGMKRKLTLPKKISRKALKVALSLKAKEGKIIVVDGVAALKKTKEATKFLEKLIKSEKEVDRNSRFTFVLSQKNIKAKLTIRNLKNVEVIQFGNLNAYDVYFGGVLVIDREAFRESRTSSKDKTTGKTGSIKSEKSTKSVKARRTPKKPAKPEDKLA